MCDEWWAHRSRNLFNVIELISWNELNYKAIKGKLLFIAFVNNNNIRSKIEGALKIFISLGLWTVI